MKHTLHNSTQRDVSTRASRSLSACHLHLVGDTFQRGTIMECLLSLTVIRLPSLSPPCRLKSDPNTSGGFDDWPKREIRCVRRACRKIWERRGGELKILTRSEQAARYSPPLVTLQHRLFFFRTTCSQTAEFIVLNFCPEPYLSPRREMKKLQQISCVPSLQAAANPVPGRRGPSFTRLEGTPENL